MTHQATARAESAGTPESAAPSVRDQLETTTAALVAADGAYLHEARESVHWEQRGWLRRLVRRPRTAPAVPQRSEP